MCDFDVQKRIHEIVGEKIDNDDRFTAYDVTQQLRRENYWVKHHEVRTEVHRMFRDGDMPGYSRDLVPMGGPTPAWEYHPASSVMQTLAGLTGHLFGRSQPPRFTTPSTLRTYGHSQAGTAPTAPGSGAPVRLDRRATVCIPARFVRQVALRPGEKVHVFMDASNTQLVVRPDRTAHASPALPARRYTVDKHYNIRITHTTQFRAGLNGHQRLVLAHTDELIVTAA
jgi:antitoxin component of MazEF toxin-antitoxin module